MAAPSESKGEIGSPSNPGRVSSTIQLRLQRKLLMRAPRERLEKQRMFSEGTMPRAMFEQRRGDLGSLLEKRRTRSVLQDLNVIQEGDEPEAKGAGGKLGGAESSGSIAEEGEEKKGDGVGRLAGGRRKRLNELFGARSTADVLRRRNILRDADPEMEKRKKAALHSTHALLEKMMRTRPDTEALVRRKVIADVGELPAQDELKRARAAADKEQLVPREVTALSGKKISSVSCGWGHSSAVDEKGHVFTFGSAENGRLGTGPSGKEGKDADAPVVMPASRGRASPSSSPRFRARQLAGGGNLPSLSLAGAGGGAAKRAGRGGGGGGGALAAGSTLKHVLGLEEGRSKPEPVVSLHPFGRAQCVASGDNHTAVVAATGQCFTWGMGSWGRLGLGNQSDHDLPTMVRAESFANDKLQSVACGGYHTVCLTRSQKVYAFGWNKNGRIGVHDNPSFAVLKPEHVVLLDGQRITQVVCGQGFTAARSADGRIFTWGAGSSGALGHGDCKDQIEPKLVESLVATKAEVSLLACGGSHVLALDAKSGTLYSWGNNKAGQLGRGKPADESFPDAAPVELGDIPKGSPVTVVAAGKSMSAAVAAKGTLFTWGDGSRGQLGHGDKASHGRPKRVETLAKEGIDTVDVACGWSHALCCTSKGAMYSWGSADKGRLGYDVE